MSWCAFLILICLAAPDDVFGDVVKSGSAYSGITVAIHKGVPENNVLIENIKNQFTGASRLLYDATGGWAYFKDITIVVPDTWKGSTYFTKVYNDPYPKAEFRVEKANEAYGEVPYTLQPGGCGESGDYVHLTPDFLLKNDEYVAKFYGSRERILVHEWSHLRYGIFDEYGIPGDKKFPLFYFNNGMMLVNICSEDARGWMETEEGSICSVFDGHVTKDCIFIPDLEDTSTRSSLMSLQYLPSVDRFCTNDNSTGRVHSWRAPSKQNLLCHGRSAWDVVSSHPDFSKQKQSVVPFAVPSFRMLRVDRIAPRYVLVLDVSSNMNGQPIELMKRSVSWFVKDLVEADNYVGIILFNHEASVLQHIVKVDNVARDTISDKLQSVRAGGGTSIGSGINLAISSLISAKLTTEDAVLIVISSGLEGNRPTINDVIPKVIDSKVKVLAVAFGASACLDLEKLGAISGGRSILFQNMHGFSTADLDQILVTATTIQANSEVHIVQLLNKPLQLTEDVTQTEVTLDAELGKNAIFTLAGNVNQVDLELQSSSGKRFVASSGEFSRTEARLQYKFPVAESGKWNVTVRKAAGAAGVSTVDLGLVSEPRNSSEQPIKVNARISEQISATKAAKIFVQVTKGYEMVIRATVEAEVVSDLGRKIMIHLNDNGAGADAIADDGIYTGFFTDFRVNEKRYTVTAKVTNRGQAFVKPARSSSSPILLRRQPRAPPKTPSSNRFKLSEFQVLSEDPYADVPLGDKAADFDRTSNGGSFTLADFNQYQVDKFKPSPVNDLSVVETGDTKDKRKFISLTWTSPGDNMDFGTPAKLEVRLSLNGNNFFQSFDSGYLAVESDVLRGDLKPQEGGKKHQVTLAIPKELLEKTIASKPFDVYVAVRATDKAGNVGDLGKIVAGNFGYEIPVCVKPTGLFPRARHCDQFYYCSNGTPYVKDCPKGMHYSMHRMRCEWPCSAKCDGRIKCSDQS